MGYYYEWYKSKNICPVCGRNTPAEGYVACRACLDIKHARYIAWKEKLTPEQLDEYRAQWRANRARRREREIAATAKNICIRCGKFGVYRRGLCYACYRKYADKQKATRLRRKMENMSAISPT